MIITANYLNTQISDLKKQQEQHLANFNAVGGAVQVYEQLLAYLNLEEIPSQRAGDES